VKSIQKRVCDLYIKEYLSCSDISSQLNICQATVYNILKNNNIILRDKSTANKIFSDDLLIKLYNIGLSCSQIGKVLGIHPSTVVKRFQKCDFPLRNKNLSHQIKYSEDEFNKYFMCSSFMDLIKQG